MRRYLLVAAILVVAALFTGVFLGPRVFTLTIATGGRADTMDDETSVTVTSFQEGR